MTEAGLAESSDAALISRIRDGDVSAYGALYERHLPAARGLARHLTGRDAADDAVQDAFAKILNVNALEESWSTSACGRHGTASRCAFTSTRARRTGVRIASRLTSGTTPETAPAAMGR